MNLQPTLSLNLFSIFINYFFEDGLPFFGREVEVFLIDDLVDFLEGFVFLEALDNDKTGG